MKCLICLVVCFSFLKETSQQTVTNLMINEFHHGNTELSLESRILAAEASNVSISHNRRRRYVVFPEGSTFTMAFCVSVKALTGLDTIFTEGTNWALSYDLPNETYHERLDREKLSQLPMRRHKRELYKRAEILMNSAGFDGQTCILRTICETAQLIPPRQGVIQEIIRLIFTYPLRLAAAKRQKGSHWDYGVAHQQGTDDQNCHDIYPCPISLLELLLRFGTKHEDPFLE